MKVIKNNKAWARAVTCVACSSILEIESTDVYATVDDSNHARYFVVDCPVCLRFVELDERTLPEWVRRERANAPHATKPA